jgi:hypothetical protein
MASRDGIAGAVHFITTATETNETAFPHSIGFLLPRSVKTNTGTSGSGSTEMEGSSGTETKDSSGSEPRTASHRVGFGI